MKTLLAIGLLAAMVRVGFSQGQIFPGTVNFYTAVSPGAVISYRAGTFLGGATGAPVDGALHPTARAALYMGQAGATRDQLVMVTPAAPFGSGALAGYITAGPRNVPTLPQGYVNAVAQIRVWDSITSVAASYEAAIIIPGSQVGESLLYTLGALGGPGDANATPPVQPATPANIPNFVGFAFGVPEPSTVALGALGLGALWLLRRKR